MKLLFTSLFFFSSAYLISAQSTYYEKISQNGSPSSQYIFPQDSVLSLEAASLNDSGNTFIIIGTRRSSSQLLKIDSLGKSIYAPLGAGYHSTAGTERASTLHSTNDGGCIFALNYDNWVPGPLSGSHVIKVDNSCQIQWDVALPGRLISGVPYQIIYDIGLLPNANYACLCENRMYLLDSLGNLLDSINYYGPGSVSAFSNGDLFVNTNSFKGRIQINGSVVWQTSDSLLTRDTNIVALRNDTLHFLNPMTGLSFTSIPFTQNGDNKALLMKDGGWCTYNSTTIQRFDTNGQLKWQESVTLAHFGIQLIVEQSNGSLLTGGTYLYQDCNYNEYDFSSFIGTIDTLGKSIMDSTYQVWPGDGDDNGISEFGDLVYIALAQGSTGPSRIDTSSIFWNSYFCVGDIATNFPHCFAIGVNHQQCDAVSDGIIDSIDIVGFGDYSSTFNSTITPWRISNPDVHKSQSILPYFSLIPDKDTVNAGDSIRVAIVIGGNGVSVDSIFGLAFSFINDTSFTGAVYNYNAEIRNSQLGFQNDLQFYHRDNWNPFVCFMAARKDLQNAYMVHDTIGYMESYIDTSLSQSMDFNFVITSFKAITAGGFPVDFQYDLHPIHANRVPLTIHENLQSQIQIFPNPSQERLHIIHLPNSIFPIRIYNEQGQECYSISSHKSSDISIDISNLTKGLYLLKIGNASETIFSKKFVKE